MTKLVVTKALERRVMRAYKRLQSTQQVAKAMFMGASTVHRILKRHGVECDGLTLYRQSIRKLPPRDELRREYEGGLSLNKIAEKYGVCLQSAHEAVQKSGAVMNVRGQQKLGEVVTDSRGLPRRDLSGRMIRRGRTVTPEGYVYVLLERDNPMNVMATKHGYVMEHRLVMAGLIGRPLSKRETVHHINGKRDDNRPENLQLRMGAHGSGIVVECAKCGSTNITYEELH